MDESTEADLDLTYNVNLKGAFFGVQSAVRQFRTQDKNSMTVPLKRWGETSDVANLASYLASDESSYVHSDLIRIDGGETLCRSSV
ncbi:hypothetical protein DV737_g1822, partial [Chaetothyriales sp. CBS 132003]